MPSRPHRSRPHEFVTQQNAWLIRPRLRYCQWRALPARWHASEAGRPSRRKLRSTTRAIGKRRRSGPIELSPLSSRTEHLIVVNKSANVLTVATDHAELNTLVNRVSHYLKHTSQHREAFVAHRLDREVSGLLVFAKSPAILKLLQDQFKQRKPERLYIAIVAGIVKPSQGTFRSLS